MNDKLNLIDGYVTVMCRPTAILYHIMRRVPSSVALFCGLFIQLFRDNWSNDFKPKKIDSLPSAVT